jgi:NAD(P)-dependent dehydrogenase (short-subunit alcohol dehydrogenase family)
MSSISAEGKVALVTGSSAGIGESVVEGLAIDGYKVVVTSRTIERARVVADRLTSLGHDVLAVAADVSRPDEIDTMFEAIDERFGRLDVLVNNAGVGAVGESETYPLRKWEKVLALNLTAPFLCAQRAAPLMKRNGGGVVVNVASIFAAIATPARAAYVSSKHGLIGLTKVLGTEWAAENIRVLAVAPSYVATEMVEEAAKAGHFDALAATGRTPLGRLGSPGEVADVIRFAVSDGARYMTGSVLWVDGGWLAYGGW